MKNILLLFCCCVAITASAQEVEFSGNAGFDGAYASEQLPFWFTANTNGLRDGLTNGDVYAFAKAEYPTSSSSHLEIGVGAMYRDGVTDRLQRAELYASFTNKWLVATLGSQQQKERYDGLSTTNGNILWSGNARAIPGIVVEAPEPIKLSKTIAVDYGLGNYFLNDDRYVGNTMVHYKRLGLHIAVNEKSTFKGTLQHYAQWGGTSPIAGKLPAGFSDFIKIFLAQNADADAPEGDQQNALGNHLGSYNFEYEYKGVSGALEAYHQHLFEDGSGTAFKNFPDGVWGLTYAPKVGVLTRILYEFVHTTDQSSADQPSVSAGDNYFSNKVYRSGWTYDGRTIGIPFILLNPETGLGISNNRIKAHHLGGSFTFDTITVNLKGSYVQDFGAPGNPIPEGINKVFTYAKGLYTTNFGVFSVAAGADFNNSTENTFGFMGGYKFVF
ncbi:hypothetical protein EAX61_00075 [Dokdonia sinensis]|uniref:Alginate export domain-containing protein n=1 Tax=Dokdonia sinensis TaxID=2479847 RepID=A0A3M0GFW8_9FLAO|nr:capsule assembly Wzi family protein [Dokdonia sinensis]RMB63825.1 hypothetical protein EAX61_00075 [Dokdonia sinensis]